MRLLEWESPGLSVNRNSKDAGRRRANKDTISVKKKGAGDLCVMLLTFFHEPCVIIQYGVFSIKESMINIFVAPEYE